MKSQKVFFAATGTLTVIALVSFALVSLGETNNEIFPTSLNADPGGTLALYQVLQQEGIPVERLFARPRVKDPRIGAVLYFRTGPDWTLLDSGPSFIEEDFPTETVILFADTGFSLIKRADYQPQEVQALVPVVGTVNRTGAPVSLAARDRHALLENRFGHAIVTAQTIEGRTYVRLKNGYAYLNRFLGQDDNAALIVSLIKSVLPPGKALALPEYAYGVGAPDNLFTRLGPSYSSALIQILVIFVLLIYSLGKRFGCPDDDPPKKPGTRHFIYALADAFRRAKCSDVVIETELKRALRIVSKKLNLPAELPEQEKLSRVPGELGAVMRTLKDWQGKRVSDSDLREVCGRLDRLLAEIQTGRWG